MADINANIGVNIDTSEALAQIKSLQRQLSQFYTSIAKSSETAALAQRDLQRNLINSVNSLGVFSAEMRTIKTTAESFTDSLEKNKFSMREYFRYAGASTKTFGKLFRSEFDTINKVAEENVKRLQTQYIKLGRDSSGAMKAIAVIPRELNMQDFATKTQMAAQKQALFNQLIKQGSTNLLNFGKNTQWAGRQLMVGFTIPLTILGNTAAKTFMEMESAALKFRKVYGDLFTPAEETQKALADVQALGQMFTRYGIAVSETVGLAAEAAAAGFQGLDLQRQVTEATRLQVLGQVDQQKALETTIALQNAFQMSSEDLAASINFLNAVENQTVVSLDDITTAIPKAAPVVKQLGGDVKDLAFFMAAMKEGGINASEGANALKSGLASLINPTDKAREMMAGFGIDIDAIVNKNAGNVKQTVIEFASALDNLSNLNRQRAIEQLFGKFQLARLSTLFENVTKTGNQASRVLDLATASTEDLAAMADKELGMTADSAMNKFRKSVEDLKFALIPVGEAFLQSVTPIVEFLGDILSKFNNLSDGAKRALTIITVGIGAIGPIALMTFGLLANALANGIKFIQILRNGYLRLTGQSQVLGEQTQYLTMEQQNAAAVAHSLDQSHARLTQTFNAETAALTKLIGAYTSAASAAQRFAMNNPGMMLPRNPKGYAGGVVSVPGPKGAGDIVPAMLSPGEAVIPADMAKKYGGLIDGMIAGNIPGFQGGLGASKRPSMTGGQSLFYSGLAMMAPGNTAGSSFGMNRSFFESGSGFGSSLLDAMSGGAFVLGKDTGLEKRMKVTDQIYEEYTSELRQYSEEIVQTLRSTASSSDSMSQILAKSKDSLDVTFGRMREAGGKAALAAEAVEKHMFFPGVEELSGQYGEVRAPTIRQGKPASSASMTRTPFVEELGRSGTSRFQSPVESFFKRTVKRNPALGNIGASYAHVNDARLLGPTLAMTGRATAPGVVTPAERIAMESALAAKGAQATAAYSKTEIRPAVKLKKQAIEDARTYEEVIEQNTKDIYVESRDRTSPHPLAAKDGRDDAAAYSQARDKELGRRGRRGARSAGGTVGPGGVIISGGTGGGGGGGGSTFLGMPGMPERQPPRKTMRQRFAGIRGNIASGKYAGAGMGASMGVMAASMIPGKMGELASKMMPVIFGFQALQMILKFLPGPFKLLAVGVGITAGLIKLVNAARERERQSIEGLADAATMTADKMQTLGDFFGVVPTTTPFETDLPQLVTSPQQRTQLDQLKGSEGFQKSFGKDIANLRKATAKEAELVFKSLAVELQGKGFATEQVQTIIDALREEAGKTDVQIDVKSLKLNTKQGQAGLKQTADDITTQFATAFSTGFEEKMTLVGSAGQGGRGSSQWINQLFPTKELKKQSKAAGAEISNLINGISGQFRTGQISADQFNQSFNNIEKTINALNKSNPAAAIMLMENVMSTLPEKSRKAAAGIKSVEGNMLLLKMQSLGLTANLAGVADALKILENPLSDVSDRIKAQKTYDDAVKNTVATAKKLEKALKDAYGAGDGSGDGEKSAFQKLKEQLIGATKETKNSITAFNKLKTAGIDTARAIELSKDPLLAMVLSAKLTKKQFKEIIDLVKGLDKVTDKSAFKDFINNLKAGREAKQNFAGLAAQMKSMGLEAADIESILNNPELLNSLTDGAVSATERFRRLQELVNEITAAKIIDIKLRLEYDEMGLIKETSDKAQEFYQNEEARALLELESTQAWKDQVAIIEKANATIKKGEEDIAKYQASINDLEYELKYDPKIGEQRIRDIEELIAKEQKLINAEQEKIDKIQSQIDLEQEKIDKINEQIDASQKIIDDTQRYLDLNFDRPIQKLQEESEVLSNSLDIIGRQEDAINEKYDKQEEALSNVLRLNQQIADQKKQQVSLADALTQGDISAAAQIAQEIQASKAEAALEAQQNALQAGRQSELAGVTAGGMTRGQIEERQFQISQQIFNLEQQRKPFLEAIRAEEDKIYALKLTIEPLERNIAEYNRQIEAHKKQIAVHELAIKGYEGEIEAIEVKREKLNKDIRDYQAAIDKINKEDIEPAKTRVKQAQDIQDALKKSAKEVVDNLPYLGLTRADWDAIQKSIETGKLDGDLLAKATGAMHKDVAAMVDKWANMPPVKELTLNTTENVTRYITEVITQIINQVPGNTGGGGGTGGAGGAGIGPAQVAAMGGKIKAKYFARGGRALGSDVVPAMLTPGEFVMTRSATARFEPLLNAMNQGGYMGFDTQRYRVSNAPEIVPTGSTQVSTVVNNTSTPVYNYSLSVNVNGTDADPNMIASTVMSRLRQMQNSDIRRQVV